jgi:hypothetical protein
MLRSIFHEAEKVWLVSRLGQNGATVGLPNPRLTSNLEWETYGRSRMARSETGHNKAAQSWPATAT